MRILFLTRLFYPHIGGVEKHVMEVSTRLVKLGHEVTVVTEKLPKEFRIQNLEFRIAIKNLEFRKLTILRIPVGKSEFFKKFRIWWWLWKHRKLIIDADIIHCHDVFFWYFPFRFLFPQKKVYITFHGYENYPISKKAIILRKISEILSFGNICIGDFIKKWYGTNPTFVSYGGVDSIIQNSEFRIQNKSAVFVGRLDEQTGILTYLKAIELVKKKVPGFKFTVIGDGKFKDRIPKSVKVLGFQKNPERFFSESHFAFVSRYLSILEAMAQKRLVFAVYDNPLKEDYLRMAPFSKFIIISNSGKELASKALFFLKHPDEEKRMTDKAFNWVKNQTWDQVLQIYLTLWQK